MNFKLSKKFSGCLETTNVFYFYDEEMKFYFFLNIQCLSKNDRNLIRNKITNLEFQNVNTNLPFTDTFFLYMKNLLGEGLTAEMDISVPSEAEKSDVNPIRVSCLLEKYEKRHFSKNTIHNEDQVSFRQDKNKENQFFFISKINSDSNFKVFFYSLSNFFEVCKFSDESIESSRIRNLSDEENSIKNVSIRSLLKKKFIEYFMNNENLRELFKESFKEKLTDEKKLKYLIL